MGVERDLPSAVALTDEVERHQHSACMIPVAVGEDDPLNSSEIDPQPGDVAREDILFWSRVEEDSVPTLAAIGRDQA